MSIWRNVTKHPVRIETAGPLPEGKHEIPPGGTVTLMDCDDFIIATQTGEGHMEKVQIPGLDPEETEGDGGEAAPKAAGKVKGK